MGQEYQSSSPEDNDDRGTTEDVTANVTANVTASTPRKGSDFNDVTDVTLPVGVYGEAGAGGDGVEPSSLFKTISSAKRASTPTPSSAVTLTGAELLDQMVKALRRHLILKPHQAETMALWVIHALGLNAFQISPRLHIRSPVYGCGKTTLMALLEDLTAPEGFLASSFTVAAYVRSIENVTSLKDEGKLENRDTTLIVLLDEVDKLISEDKRTMLGILNSGHTRAGAKRLMNEVVGNNYVPKSYSTWAATAFASIGPLPTELESRSIVIDLQRKRPNERVSKLSAGDKKNYRELAKLAAGWVRGHFEALEDAEPACPDCLYNRARDNWLPLLAVADVAGGHWPRTARAAATALSGEDEDPTEGVKLLADIRLIFDRSGKDRLATNQILRGLAGLEERSWGAYGDRAPRELTDRDLASLLKPFGIGSSTIRTGAGTIKGYKRAWFEDAWSRYLSYTPSPSVTSITTNDFNDLDHPPSVTFAVTRSVTEEQPQQSLRLGERAGLVA
jgi:putative DNA primase/helicase